MAMSKAEIEAIFPDESEEKSVDLRDTEAILFAEDDDLPPELQKKLLEDDEAWRRRLAAAGIVR
ncbi:MAG: hypothetical protein J6E31_10190 [Pyramidobacter sp.]|nr:hypothetical protein [Schwartzia sp. (in: firmicutes)]MBP3837451.1 hypothetical protein [Pyramidobacter sp.]